MQCPCREWELRSSHGLLGAAPQLGKMWPSGINLIGHRPLAAAAHQAGVLAQNACSVAGLGLHPGSPAAGDLRLIHVELDQQPVGIHGDAVALLHQADSAAHGGLGGDVADHQAEGAAGEAAVGDQGH